MTLSNLTVALITEVFQDHGSGDRLAHRLSEARHAGAELAVLPELPMDRWIPANRHASRGDAEDPGGRRQRTMARAAAAAGLAVLGGAIVRDPGTGARHNTALLYDRDGTQVLAYRKLHLPFEPGFWEASHYRPGDQAPEVYRGMPLALGVQICSDANRPTGCQLLAAQGAAVILVPRATPATSWARWRLVLGAAAVTSAAWVVSVNRRAEGGSSLIGGPSVVIAPDGELRLEATDGIAVIRLDGATVARARADYPGYLEFPARVYARGWQAARRDLTGE
jgi:N-carbamoylputrescine amidase